MKSFRVIGFFIIFLTFTGCEEVVNIELNETPPRLVVEASILKDKSQSTVDQFIRLSLTGEFYTEEVPVAQGAIVSIRDENGSVFAFEEIEPGLYRNENLTPQTNIQYSLEIIYKEETYQASERYINVADLEYVEQNNEGGFAGEDIELKVYFTDPPEEGNYYLLRFIHEDLSVQIYDDELVNGNLTFGYFADEDIKPGDTVNFEIQGISQRYYEYMFILRSQAGTGGGPFQTQPTTVKGNITNITNPDNYPFGYFRLSEIDQLPYTVE